MNIFNILKNLIRKINKNEEKTIISTTWTAASSSSIWTQLTQNATLTKGKWLAVCQIPIISTTTVGVRLNAGTGTTTLSNDWYAMQGSQTTVVRLFEVTSDTATVFLACAQSAAVTFSNLSRGGAYYIRLGGGNS